MPTAFLQEQYDRERRWLLVFTRGDGTDWTVKQAPTVADAIQATGMNPGLFVFTALVDHIDMAAALYPKLRTYSDQVRELAAILEAAE